MSLTAPEYFSYGALFIGFACLVIELADWYPGLTALRKHPTKWAASLGSFLWTWCVGAVLTLCVGGLVGLATGWFIWGAGWLGDAAYVAGLGGQRQEASRIADVALTPGGIFMAGLLILVTVIRVRKGGTSPSKIRGLISGILMSCSAGVAATVAVPLASAVNISGAWLTGAL